MSTSKEKTGRAIITFSRGWQTLVAVRSLGSRGVEVITGDEYAMTPASFSRYSKKDFRYPDPSGEPEEFLNVLEQTVTSNKPSDPKLPYVLMPIHKETYLIAANRERFEPHIKLAVPNIEQIELVHNKGSLASYAMKQGISLPQTWIPKDVEEFEACVENIPLPAFVKLRESAAGVGIQKVDSREELVETFHEFIKHFKLQEKELPLVQAAVPGDDYCVTCLFNRGVLVASMTYHNLRAYPADRGAGVMRETVHAPAMEKISADLLGSLGWHGVAQLDFRWDGNQDNDPFLIEVNPRFWGGLIQAVESGWDYPWLLFRLAAEGSVELSSDPDYDVRTETPVLALLATLKEIAENDQGDKMLVDAWDKAKQEFSQGSKREGIRLVFDGVKQLLEEKPRINQARELLKEHQDNIYDILSLEDPLPALGVFYPLAVLLRHGKVNMELLTGESGPSSEQEG